jgi:hypothetical protein
MEAARREREGAAASADLAAAKLTSSDEDEPAKRRPKRRRKNAVDGSAAVGKPTASEEDEPAKKDAADGSESEPSGDKNTSAGGAADAGAADAVDSGVETEDDTPDQAVRPWKTRRCTNCRGAKQWARNVRRLVKVEDMVHEGFKDGALAIGNPRELWAAFRNELAEQGVDHWSDGRPEFGSPECLMWVRKFRSRYNLLPIMSRRQLNKRASEFPWY